MTEPRKPMSREIEINDYYYSDLQYSMDIQLPETTSKALPLAQHHQNIQNAFRMSDRIQTSLQTARSSTQTTPAQKAISQILRPEVIPVTKNFISNSTTIEQLFDYSAYPQLEDFYVQIADDLMDTMSLPLSPIKEDNLVQMDSQRLPVLFGILQDQSMLIPQKIVKLIELIDVESLKFSYKRKLISLLVKKADEVLQFGSFKVGQDVTNQIVLNKFAMKQLQNDDKIIQQQNNLILNKLLDDHKKRQPYDFEQLGKKRVQQSIRKKFIHENKIQPRHHWSQVQDKDLIDIRKSQAELIAIQALKSP